jgi:hypothetical protein
MLGCHVEVYRLDHCRVPAALLCPQLLLLATTLRSRNGLVPVQLHVLGPSPLRVLQAAADVVVAVVAVVVGCGCWAYQVHRWFTMNSVDGSMFFRDYLIAANVILGQVGTIPLPLSLATPFVAGTPAALLNCGPHRVDGVPSRSSYARGCGVGSQAWLGAWVWFVCGCGQPCVVECVCAVCGMGGGT